jgi:hypothetical protein
VLSRGILFDAGFLELEVLSAMSDAGVITV